MTSSTIIRFGRVIRPSTATDLLTLAVGMVLGFLIGQIEVPALGASVGLGNAGGLLVSGVIVSSFVSRLRFFGNTPAAARNVLAVEIQSNVPWIGFPIGYAVSGILLTVFGYFAMVLAQ